MSTTWLSRILHVIDAHPATLGVAVAIAISYAALLVHRRHQARHVRSWLDELATTSARSERGIAIALAGRLHEMRRQTGQDPLIPIVGRVLGATPGAVLKHGGCCAGLSRLCIVSLAELGIPARQITLYHRGTGKAQHCLVEAFPSGEPLIVDPAYGLYYAAASGHGLGLASLQEGIVPILHGCPMGEPAAYPPYPYYDFDFPATKTANWTKSEWRRAAYQVLHMLTNGAIDRVGPPPWLEWPQLQCVVLLTIAAAIHVSVLLFKAMRLG